MKQKHKAAAGAGSLILLLIIILASIDRESGFTEKMTNDMKDSSTPEYIGKPEAEVSEGKMTPEILLSLGRPECRVKYLKIQRRLFRSA